MKTFARIPSSSVRSVVGRPAGADARGGRAKAMGNPSWWAGAANEETGKGERPESAPARLVLFEPESELIARLHEAPFPLSEAFDLLHHVVDVSELAVDAREPHVRDFVEVAQRRHDALADQLAR